MKCTDFVNVAVSFDYSNKVKKMMAEGLPIYDVELKEGTILTLVPEPTNVKDPSAVQVMMDDTLVGYLSNRNSTVPRTCIPAVRVSRMMSRSEVAGANIRLLHRHMASVQVSGAFVDENGGPIMEQEQWVAEIFYIPVWSAPSKADAPHFELSVGGSRVANGDLATVMDNFDSYTDDDLVAKLFQMPDGTEVVKIFVKKTMDDPNSVPAGEVSTPPSELIMALRNTSMIPVKPVEVKNTRKYIVSVTLDPSTGIEEFQDDMKELAEMCRMQVRDSKERIQYLLSQHVPAPIIHGVLDFIQYEDKDACIRRPRQLFVQSTDDNCLTRALGYYLSRLNIRLVGEKGSGKNTLVSTVSWLMNKSLCRIQGNADIDKLDLFGSQALDEHGTTFELSAFTKALRDGDDVVLDEINSVKPDVAIALHSLTDGDRSIEIPGYGFVEVNPRSRIWGTMNEDYVGTGEMNAATADRFVPLHLKDQMDLGKLLSEMFPNAPAEDIGTCATLYKQILQAYQDGRCSSEAITTRGYIDALEASQYLPLKDVLLDNVAGRPQNSDDRRTIADFIRAMIA